MEANEICIIASPIEKNSKYPYPKEFNVLDVVPKLSDDGDFIMWKKLIRHFIRRQGLIDFIDKSEVPDDDAWKKSDKIVQQWIMATLSKEIRLRVLGKLKEEITRQRTAKESEETRLRTAKEWWDRLLEIFDWWHRPLLPFEPEKVTNQAGYLGLQKAAIKGDWIKAREIIDNEPGAVRKPITPNFGETVLHLAISSSLATPVRNHGFGAEQKKNICFVRELLKKMTPQDVKKEDYNGATALHYAAQVGNMAGAKMLVEKSSDLPNAEDKWGDTPLHDAAKYGQRKMVRYLMGKTTAHLGDGKKGASLLRDLIFTELYEDALTLLNQKPELVFEEPYPSKQPLKGPKDPSKPPLKKPNDLSEKKKRNPYKQKEPNPFDILVEKPSSFKSGSNSSWFRKFLVKLVPLKSEGIDDHNEGGGCGDMENQAATDCCISVRRRLHLMIWNVAKKLVRSDHLESIKEEKWRHHYAPELVKFLCKEVAKKNLPEVERMFKPALIKAASLGISEIIEEIVLSYPSALFFVSVDNINIVTYAILNRRERVFNLIHQTGWRYIYGTDYTWNNVLHLAARYQRKQEINLKGSTGGAVLQMQREVQWYKEVEKFTPPGYKECRNIDGMTPLEVFSDTHQGLVKEAQEWMKDTASSCTIVAVLIVAMVFAAAITVPGGNKDDNGHPIFLKRTSFIIFCISDALALFSSITSVLMFLLILTSRWAEEDFLYTLPKRLIIGLITLFVSILFTMIAFCAILYLVFGDHKKWIFIPTGASASIPVILFGLWQLPLLYEMFRSVYWEEIFRKQGRHPLR